MMFGPVPGLIMGGAADLLGFVIKPTGPFFPGYTLDSMIAGFLYGMFFYKREKLTLFSGNGGLGGSNGCGKPLYDHQLDFHSVRRKGFQPVFQRRFCGMAELCEKVSGDFHGEIC